MITRGVEWGPVGTWAGAIATVLVVITTTLVALGYFDGFRGPRLRLTFEATEPWCRQGKTEGDGTALWVRVGVENLGASPARGCLGRLISVTTNGALRPDVDPVQLRWAGVPRSRADYSYGYGEALADHVIARHYPTLVADVFAGGGAEFAFGDTGMEQRRYHAKRIDRDLVGERFQKLAVALRVRDIGFLAAQREEAGELAVDRDRAATQRECLFANFTIADEPVVVPTIAAL